MPGKRIPYLQSKFRQYFPDSLQADPGLSTDYRIVRAHQGDINIESEVGKGTEVTIRLPVKGNHAE